MLAPMLTLLAWPGLPHGTRSLSLQQTQLQGAMLGNCGPDHTPGTILG